MLRRRLSLLQAVSLNMAMMVGIGPFITIPELLAAMGGPQAMVGWVLGAILAMADGLVWSELAAALPGSGGTFHFYDAVYGTSRVGRLLKFLFVWQFLFSAPLELASGAMGVTRYAGYLWPSLKTPVWQVRLAGSDAAGLVWRVDLWQLLAMGVMAAIVMLAYRRIEAAGRLMVVLWAGMLVTVAWVIGAGLVRFHPAIAFELPSNAWKLDRTFALGLGAAMAIAMYDYLGYYQICYLGDEVNDPARTMPRSILISVPIVALAYMAMTLSLLGVIPWRSIIGSQHIVSDFMLRLHGAWAARLVTLLIVWTALAGTFAALLSYSRVPYAAARSGHFFRALSQTHPKGDFPHRSLILIGAVAIVACLADLQAVIMALLTSRILIQFVGQVVTVLYMRTRPDLLARMPFRMWLFPLPALIALAGWLFVFGTSDQNSLIYGLVSLAVGLLVFLAWDRLARRAKLDPEAIE
ncbi:MAG TPA: APC family permease [Isosphaeraceae bacterium]|jgi:amino acid transporter|nr:APC family permease [Isosphaeraceae bacterium]